MFSFGLTDSQTKPKEIQPILIVIALSLANLFNSNSIFKLFIPSDNYALPIFQ